MSKFLAKANVSGNLGLAFAVAVALGGALGAACGAQTAMSDDFVVEQPAMPPAIEQGGGTDSPPAEIVDESPSAPLATEDVVDESPPITEDVTEDTPPTTEDAVGEQLTTPSITDAILSCSPPPAVGDFNLSPPLASTLEGIVSVGAAPLEYRDPPLTLTAYIGLGANRCVGGTEELRPIAGTQAGFYLLTVVAMSQHIGQIITFELSDQFGTAVAVENAFFTGDPSGIANLNLSFGAYPAPASADAITVSGRAIFSSIAGSNPLSGAQIFARVTSPTGQVYESPPTLSGESGDFFLIVAPGTVDFIGREVEFYTRDADGVTAVRASAVTPRVTFTGDSAFVSGVSLAYPLSTTDAILSCSLPPAAGDFNLLPPLVSPFEGVASVGGAPIEYRDPPLTLTAYIGLGANRCIGGTAELRPIAGTQTGFYLLTVVAPSQQIGQLITFELSDESGEAVAAENAFFTGGVSRISRLNLSFGAYPAPASADAITISGSAIFSSIAGSNPLSGAQIFARVTSPTGQVYESPPTLSGESGDFFLIVAPGTVDFIGREVEFYMRDADGVTAVRASAVTPRVTFTGDSAFISGVSLAFLRSTPGGDSIGSAPLGGVLLTARLIRETVEESDGAAELIILRDTATQPTINEMVSIRLEITDSGNALTNSAPVRTLTLAPGQDFKLFEFALNNDEIASPNSLVSLRLLADPDSVFYFEDGEQRLLLTVEDDD